MSTSNSPYIQRRRRWPKVLGVVVVLLVGGYFFLTSSVFLKSFVLPKVSSAIGSEVSVEDISLSPFSSVTVRGLKVTPKGEAALAEVREFRARFSLFAILGGKIQVDEVTVDGPSIHVIEKADGSGNLATLLKSLPKSEPETGKSPAPRLAVRNVSVKGGTVRFERTAPTGERTQAEISGFGVAVDQLVNGQSSKITVGAEAKAELIGGPQAGRAAGKLGGTIDVTLDDQLLPTASKGGIRLDLTDMTGGLQSFAGLGLSVDVDFAKDDLKDLALRFSQRGQELARIGLKGALELQKQEARLTYEIRGLDRRILALAGAASGLDLGETKVGATGRFDVLKGGAEYASSGKLQIESLSLAGNGTRTPAVNLSTEYRVLVNPLDKKALVDRLDILGTQAGRELVKGGLDRSMSVSWDKAAPGFRESTFSLKAGPIDLSQWRAMLPSNAPTALVSTDFKVTSDQAGKLLRFALNTKLDQLTASVGSARVRDAQASILVTGTVADFTAVVVEGYQVDVRMGRDQLLGLNGVADWNLDTAQGGAQLSVEGQLPPLLGLYPMEGVNLSSGGAKVSATFTQRSTGSAADVNVSLANLGGTLGTIVLKDYQVTFGLAAAIRGEEVDVQRVSLASQSGFVQGGSFMARGKYNLVREAGTIEFNTVGVNESALGPFLAPSLAPSKVTSVALDIQGKADVALTGSSALTAAVKLSNLVVDDPTGRTPKTPIQLGIDIDVTSNGVRTEVRKFLVDLGATERATNRLEIAGLIDLGTNQPAPTALTVRSTGLDFTPLYNLVAGATNAPATAQPPVQKPDAGNVEPAPVHLPIRDATLTLDIARVFLREIDVAGLKGTARASNDVVSLDGFGLTLNGAPVRAKARANLAVPGYQYDVDFAADRVPLGPLANSFVPVLNNAAQGEAGAALQVRGAGLTGASLRRNLNGFATMEATNAQIRIPNRPIPVPKLVTTLIPILPSEINPTFVLSLIGKSAVLSEPIRIVEAHALMGQGGVILTNTRVANSAFVATVGGDIQFADNLTNSTLNLPVALAFASNGQMPEPRKVGRVAGTIGVEKFEKDLVGIAAVVGAVSIPGVGNVGDLGAKGVEKLNQATGGAVQKIGNAVGGLVPGGDKPTNGAASAVGGLLNVLGGGKNTNAPAANTNAAPKPTSPLDLLPFGRGKK